MQGITIKSIIYFDFIFEELRCVSLVTRLLNTKIEKHRDFLNGCNEPTYSTPFIC